MLQPQRVGALPQLAASSLGRRRRGGDDRDRPLVRAGANLLERVFLHERAVLVHGDELVCSHLAKLRAHAFLERHPSVLDLARALRLRAWAGTGLPKENGMITRSGQG